jgi:sarcosine oxidase subunit alpha
MRVYMTSVTEQWSTFGLVGPKARAVLEKVCTEVDLSLAAFPFMSYREGTVCGVAARIMRISFSGELSFEVNVPSHYGASVWAALMAAGAEFNITPYGTETMHVLRAEKGYIIVGQDTDGSVTPHDLAWAAWCPRPKTFWVAVRSPAATLQAPTASSWSACSPTSRPPCCPRVRKSPKPVRPLSHRYPCWGT